MEGKLWTVLAVVVILNLGLAACGPTPTPVPTDTPTPVPPTDTPVPPTDTPVPPTDTPTPVPPTDTPVPPTDTPTPVPPTNIPTPVPPTDTPAPVPVTVVPFDSVANPDQYESLIDLVDNWEGPAGPGHYKWQVQFPAGQDVSVYLGWCTKDRQTLEENWSHMSHSLTIDGQVIDLEGLSREPSDKCREYWGLTKGWERGPHSCVWTISIDQPIHDGWDSYPAGDYVMEFEIDVY
jgi:hypothetical protein